MANIKLIAKTSLFVMKKYSPEILTGVGIVGGVTAAVFGARATVKLEPIIDEMTTKVTKAKTFRADEKAHGGQYDDEKLRHDLKIYYTRATVDIIKLYAVPVSIGMASIACILGAHGIMRQRNVALVAAYNLVATSFAEYRKRVQDSVGEEAERDLYHGVSTTTVVDEDGGTHTIKTVDRTKPSMYCRFFDETNENWNASAHEYNLSFLQTQQNWCNDKLHADGHLFLNDAYKALGFEPSSAGQIVGWIIEGSGRGEEGDEWVDFGIYDITNQKAREFVNGQEAAILLDFNVDGIMYHRI